MGDNDLVTITLGVFARSVAECAGRLNRLAAAGDGHGAARAAHELKGAAATACAGRLTELAISVEQAARVGAASLASLAHELADEADRCARFARTLTNHAEGAAHGPHPRR